MVIKKWNVIRQTICWWHSELMNQVNSKLITALWATMCLIHGRLRVKQKHLCTGGKSYLFFFKSKKYQPARLISWAAASIWVVLVVFLFLVCLLCLFFLMAAVALCFCPAWKDADWSRLGWTENTSHWSLTRWMCILSMYGWMFLGTWMLDVPKKENRQRVPCSLSSRKNISSCLIY